MVVKVICLNISDNNHVRVKGINNRQTRPLRRQILAITVLPLVSWLTTPPIK